MKRIAITIILGAIFLFGGARAQPPAIEYYGQLPEIRSMAMSPDGSKVAYLVNDGEQEALAVYDLAEGPMVGLNTSEVKATGLYFLNEDYIILRASKTTRTYGFRGKYEFSAAFSYNIKTQKVRQLLAGTQGLFPAQSGLGAILGSYKDDQVLMPAYMGDIYSENPKRHLLRVNLDTGRGRSLFPGRPHSLDWIVDNQGKFIAREDYNQKSRTYRIYSGGTGKDDILFEVESDLIPMSLVGIKHDRSALVVQVSDRNGYTTIYELDFEGEWSQPIFQREGLEVEHVLATRDREVFGVKYTGLQPSYDFFDAELTADIQTLVDNYEAASVHVIDFTDDMRKVLIQVSGSGAADEYLMYDRDEKQVSRIASGRSKIPATAIGDVLTIEYPARDGLTIPALLTVPYGAPIENLPLIVMPHGGPEHYDQVGFDWIAQYFASRGYAVFQPNFRGSDGFGADFLLAGRGKWGKEMQHDITDGVNLLAKGGMIDPDRVCIVGASYGGYAALAGGAYTPELYKCVVAIAAVTDLPRMLSSEANDNGRNSWVYRYWTRVIGDRKEDREALKDVSPARAADQFQAPVLLIHGKDDTVVPMNQSDYMARALRQADKPYEMIKLNNADHWLLDGQTRLETLQATAAFVEQHIGGE